jgi:FkbM family methyltransferase
MAVAGWYEPGVSEVLTPLCRRTGHIVDVGANVGWYTFLAAARVGAEGLVLAFEPDPENFHLLSTSLAENPRPQVRIFQQCLSDHVGEEQLFLSDLAASYHSTVEHVGSRSVRVPATSLDEVVRAQGLRSIDLVKIDVEGGEPKVLRGARETLRTGIIRNLIIEWAPDAWTGKDALWNEVTNGMDVYRIEMSPRLLVRIQDPAVDHVNAEIRDAGRHGNDLYLARKPRKDGRG